MQKSHHTKICPCSDSEDQCWTFIQRSTGFPPQGGAVELKEEVTGSSSGKGIKVPGSDGGWAPFWGEKRKCLVCFGEIHSLQSKHHSSE